MRRRRAFPPITVEAGFGLFYRPMPGTENNITGLNRFLLINPISFRG